MKTYFFGWTNFKWLIRELLKVASNEDSFFSKKRIESGIAFIIMQWGMIYFIIHSMDKMTSSDLLIWAGIEGVVCGYTLTQIQKEKALEKTEDPK
jgi:hypothetical protein